jgi:hypothetical protein
MLNRMGTVNILGAPKGGGGNGEDLLIVVSAA